MEGFIDNLNPTYGIDQAYIKELEQIYKDFSEKDAEKYESFLRQITENIGHKKQQLKIKQYSSS